MRKCKLDGLILEAGDDVRTRFWSQVTKTKTCWLFTGSKSTLGYGRIFISGKYCSAHRAAKIWSDGISYTDKVACHIRECFNKNCINPEHIYWGTDAENMQDSVALKTNFYASSFGEKHRGAVFTNEEVRNIWMMLRDNPLKLKMIGDKYNVDSRNIYVIREKIAWRHITDMLPDIPLMVQASDFPPIERKKHQRLTESQIDQICKMLDARVTLSAVVKHASSCGHTINDVYFQRKGKLPDLRGAAPRTKKRTKKIMARKAG